MKPGANLDLLIVGGGIGGVICLKYAKDAGLNVLLLESKERIGGLWRDVPFWQDIQFRKEDWALGELPLAGEDQANILRNIEAWAEHFDLVPNIVLNATVTDARRHSNGWRVRTDDATYETKWLIAATGGHNDPVIPEVEREDASIVEYHSSALRDPEQLKGRRVTVVGGGASAYDLLDLCFEHDASSVSWIYRSTKWMRPTRQRKYDGIDMRLLSRYQMLGLPVAMINKLANKDLRIRYQKSGIAEIMPEGKFDISRDQLIPGRWRMIRNFGQIARYRGEVRAVNGNTITVSNGQKVDSDLLLWGTGYRTNMDYLDVEGLKSTAGLNDMAKRCYSAFRSMDADNLFLLAPGVLETNTATPWAYAHVARSIMSHIKGVPVFMDLPQAAMINHYDLVKILARRDSINYPFGRWYLKYFSLAMFHPKRRPLPLP
ncbi:MAG: NAD(P)/FAD-dependent oxidoreductase [Betaproteobacteria bacterium]|nr:MAG: NAD(P)/FAD-dependent oxidoreductase [Betaproteobacteria bacterium]